MAKGYSQPSIPGMDVSQTRPVDAHIRSSLERYATEGGFTLPKSDDVTHGGALRNIYQTALDYRDAQSAPEHPDIKASYKSLGEHIGKQFDFITRPEAEGGMGFTYEVTPEDPYANDQELREDLARKHIKVLSTKGSGGSEALGDDMNDKFRAVHDVIGHGATGHGFSRFGELSAARLHAATLPPEARLALLSELKGQNAYLVTYGYFPDQSPGSSLVGLPDRSLSFDDPVKATRKNTTPKKVDDRQGRLL